MTIRYINTLALKILILQLIIQVGRVFAKGSADQASIPGWVIPKTQKMILDAPLLNEIKLATIVKVTRRLPFR